MYITSKRIAQGSPLTNPHGEVIYELTGADPAHGAAALHSLAYVVIPPGKYSDPHYHKVAEESYALLRGQARLVVDGRAFELQAGQYVLIQPGEVHQIFNDGEVDLEFLAVCAPPWTADDAYPVEVPAP